MQNSDAEESLAFQPGPPLVGDDEGVLASLARGAVSIEEVITKLAHERADLAGLTVRAAGENAATNELQRWNATDQQRCDLVERGERGTAAGDPYRRIQ